MAKKEEIKDSIAIEDMNMNELKSLAKENDIPVEGTGKNGAVTRKDIEEALESHGSLQREFEDKEYVVVKAFTDMQDGNHVYEEGHVYPRNNKKPDPERVEELSTKKNRRKEVLIKEKGE